MSDSADDLARQLAVRCVEAIERGEQGVVERVCAERPDLRPQVEKRLQTLESAGLLRGDEQELPSFGSYEVVRRLGSGGMGTVFLCEQTGDLRRQVALKVIKRGMDTDEVLARFRLERSTLARMQHPGIASVMDAGSTPDGRPYFAMEFVDGSPITAWCDRQQLDTCARIRLFVKVLDAVGYAHGQGILHRDIKPSNVLVAVGDGAPIVKVIDFGLTKLLDTDGGEHTAHTTVGQIVGTPEYMSPEQASDELVALDTRSDVYSLGVMLYELLTGALPIDPKQVRSGSWTAVQELLLSAEPQPPSLRVTDAAARGGSTELVRRQVQGELDWIVLKALAKEPDRRYAGVREFAADLERHLTGLPVEAAPPSSWYRLCKSVRRHRIAVTMGLAVAVTASIGAVGIVLAMWQAEANAAEATQLYATAIDAADELFYENAQVRLRGLPRASGMMFEFFGDCREFYGRLAKLRPGDPELRYRLARTDLAIATERLALGGDRDTEVEVEQQIRQSLVALHDLERIAPDDARVQWQIGVSHMRLACMFVGRANYALAQQHDATARTHLEVAAESGEPEMVSDLAECLALAYEIGGNLRRESGEEQREAPEVVALLQQATEIGRRLVETNGGDAYLTQLSTFLQSMALSELRGRRPEPATELLSEAIDLLARITPANSGSEFVLRRLASAHQIRGRIVMSMGRPAAAVDDLNRAHVTLEQLVVGNPQNRAYLREAAETGLFVGKAWFDLERYEAAATAFRRGVVHARAIAAAESDKAAGGPALVPIFAPMLLHCFEQGVIAQPGERQRLEAEQEALGK